MFSAIPVRKVAAHLLVLSFESAGSRGARAHGLLGMEVCRGRGDVLRPLHSMRTDLFERRRRLMADWEAYLGGESLDREVGPIR